MDRGYVGTLYSPLNCVMNLKLLKKKKKKLSRKISKQNTEYICVWLYLHEKLLKVPPKLIKVVTYDEGGHETDGDGGGNKTFYYTPSTFF